MHKVCEGDSASRLVWVLSHDSYGLSCPIVHDHGVNETWSTYDERMCYALVKAWAFERLRAQHVVLIYIHTYTDPVGQSWPRGQGRRELRGGRRARHTRHDRVLPAVGARRQEDAEVQERNAA